MKNVQKLKKKTRTITREKERHMRRILKTSSRTLTRTIMFPGIWTWEGGVKVT
jgi:hypothetical protein